jgi:transcriptional regulator with XRE-family HTH domain
MSLGSRIREERERLGLTQTALGVAPKTQRFYESDARKPDTGYLEHFAALGADVLYILTGRRDESSLSPDEAALLDNYRHSSETGKRTVRGAAAASAESEVEGKETAA